MCIVLDLDGLITQARIQLRFCLSYLCIMEVIEDFKLLMFGIFRITGLYEGTFGSKCEALVGHTEDNAKFDYLFKLYSSAANRL